MIDLYHDTELRDRQRRYYIQYYRDQLGLKDYEQRVSNRFREEEEEKKRIERICGLLNFSLTGKKILIVGSGTGGAISAFRESGCKYVIGVEPNKEAVAISHMKCRILGIPAENVVKGYAEGLPFDSSSFDFIYCFSVLEHVQDVKKTLHEMYRVLRSKGYLYINTPDYNYPYEGHYKKTAPTFLGKRITGFWFSLLGRNTEYLQTVNFLTKRHLDRILKSIPGIEYLRVYRSDRIGNPQERPAQKFMRLLFNTLNVNSIQEVIVTK